jgi:hypothetical protein
MSEPWLSVVGGGAVAAIVTLVFNACWDYRKQKLAEDYEFRRYEANMIHIATTGLVEAYFSVKIELFYLTSTIEALVASLDQLAAQAQQIIRQQGGPTLTIAELEQRKVAALQPFNAYNQQQFTLYWNRYADKARENHANAETHMASLKSLIDPNVHEELGALFARLSAPFTWDLPNGKVKLADLEAALPDVMAIKTKLMQQLEKKLGRR